MKVNFHAGLRRITGRKTVEFDLPGHSELKISLVLWAVPLLGLVAGAAAGAGLHPLLPVGRDLATLLGAWGQCMP